MTRRRVRLHLDFGRRKRASVLLLLGVIFVINGYVLFDTADLVARSPIAAQSYAAHLDVMPMTAWGWVFGVVGAGSAISGLVNRFPAWVGFTGLYLLAGFWAGLFVASWASTGYGRAWLGALQWGAIVGVLAIIADWEDPPANSRQVDAILGGHREH